MRQMRCPNCQAVNYEGHITFPICHRCHENLQKCRHCRNFPGEGIRCRYLPGWTLPEGDQIVECDYRESLLYEGKPQRLRYSRPLQSVMVLSVIVCSIIVVLTTVVPMLSGPADHPTTFSLTGSAPREVNLDRQVSVSLEVSNENTNDSSDYRIRLDESVFDHFKVEYIFPMPSRPVMIQNRARYYFFGGLNAKGKSRLRFHLRSVRAGKGVFEATLYSMEGVINGSYRQEIAVRKGDGGRSR